MKKVLEILKKLKKSIKSYRQVSKHSKIVYKASLRLLAVAVRQVKYKEIGYGIKRHNRYDVK